MKLINSIILSYKGIDYNVNLKKLSFVISHLENKEINIVNEQEMKFYLDKYSLYNEAFLENINKI